MNNSPAVPDFLGIGAQRSGTSWLYTQLRQHPGLWLPPVKELHFFDVLWFGADNVTRDAYRRRRSNMRRLSLAAMARLGGLRNRRSFASVHPLIDLCFLLRSFRPPRSVEDYRASFLMAKSRGLICGEITPAYSVLPQRSIERVRGLNGNMRLILLLRDPIERSWSQAVKNLCRATRRKVTDVSPREFIEFVDRPICRQRSDYSAIYRAWCKEIAPDRIYVGFFDQIVSSPGSLVKDICHFLGVDSIATPMSGLRQVVNAAARSADEIPAPVREHLAKHYRLSLRELARDFGEIPQRWLERY